MSIKLIEAQLKRDTEMIGKMDPFVRISYINKEFKTQTHSDGGKQPKWNEVFDIELQSLKDEISISVLESDITDNDIIG